MQLTPMVSFPTLDASPQIPVGVLSAAPDVCDGVTEAVRDAWIEVPMGGVLGAVLEALALEAGAVPNEDCRGAPVGAVKTPEAGADPTEDC